MSTSASVQKAQHTLKPVPCGVLHNTCSRKKLRLSCNTINVPCDSITAVSQLGGAGKTVSTSLNSIAVLVLEQHGMVETRHALALAFI